MNHTIVKLLQKLREAGFTTPKSIADSSPRDCYEFITSQKLSKTETDLFWGLQDAIAHNKGLDYILAVDTVTETENKSE